MKRSRAFVLAGCAVMAATAPPLAAPDQTHPGQPTRARVWIQNHGRGEAIPISLQDVSADPQMQVPVRVVELPAVSIAAGSVTARLAPQVWEYSSILVGPSQDPVAELNRSGQAGWETTGLQFSSPQGTVIVLKRPR